jgi:hypothetical protein
MGFHLHFVVNNPDASPLIEAEIPELFKGGGANNTVYRTI